MSVVDNTLHFHIPVNQDRNRLDIVQKVEHQMDILLMDNNHHYYIPYLEDNHHRAYTLLLIKFHLNKPVRGNIYH